MSNCLFFVLAKWWKHGGYIIIRRSKQGPYPHFIWCEALNDAKIEHFVPDTHKTKRSFKHKFVFNGIIRTDDK